MNQEDKIEEPVMKEEKEQAEGTKQESQEKTEKEQKQSEQTTEKKETEAEHELGQYDNIPRTEIPIFEKQKGTQEFKKQNYLQAIKHYSKALMAYHYLVKDGVLNNEEQISLYEFEIFVNCNCNVTLCYMKLNQYESAIQYVNQVIEVDPTNLKALYRRGVCHIHCSNFKQAEQDLKLALDIDPENTQVQSAIKLLKAKKEKSDKKYKEWTKRCLNDLEYIEEQEKVQQEKQKIADAQKKEQTEEKPSIVVGEYHKSNQTVKFLLKVWETIFCCCKKRKKEKKN